VIDSRSGERGTINLAPGNWTTNQSSYVTFPLLSRVEFVGSEISQAPA
jgi:hypothetical protein